MSISLLRRPALSFLFCISLIIVNTTLYAGEITQEREFYISIPHYKTPANSGDYEASKDGLAFGSPVGGNYTLNLEPDSIAVVAAASTCGAEQGTIHFFAHKSGSPVGLSEISLDNSQSFNYRLTPSTTVVGSSTVGFTLTPIDPSIDAHAVVVITDRTAQRVTHTAHYTAPRVVAEPSVNFGLLALGAEECREITLANPTSEPIEIRNIDVAGGNSAFTIANPTDFPLTIPAGGAQIVKVCGKGTAVGEMTDSLRISLACYTTTTTTLRMQTGQVRVTMGDWNFGEVDKETEVSRDIVIENISVGALPLELYSVDWDDKVHFRTEGIEDDKFPIVLPNVGDTYTFRVFYRPTEASVQNVAIAWFTGNAVLEKTTSTWTGQGKTTVSVSEPNVPHLWLSSIAPQPLSGSGTVHYRLDKPANLTLSVYTILGERILYTNAGMQAAGEYTLPINTANLLPGMYLCRLEAGGQSATQSLLIR